MRTAAAEDCEPPNARITSTESEQIPGLQLRSGRFLKREVGRPSSRRDLKTEGGRQDPAFRCYFSLHGFTDED